MRDSRRWTLLVVCLATAVLLLNVAAPNVALPDIGDHLDAELDVLQWVISGYMLAVSIWRRLFGPGKARFRIVMCSNVVATHSAVTVRPGSAGDFALIEISLTLMIRGNLLI